MVYNSSANVKYPDSGSSTCCQGRIALGNLTSTGVFDPNPLRASGTILSAAQSPPPITLPALALAIAIPLLKKERLYALVISSEQPLLAL